VVEVFNCSAQYIDMKFSANSFKLRYMCSPENMKAEANQQLCFNAINGIATRVDEPLAEVRNLAYSALWQNEFSIEYL
jgi:hypothetical protein